MPIKYDRENKVFTLTTKRTKYVFGVLGDRYLLHLYYGKKSGDVVPYNPYMVSFAPYPPSLGNGWSPDVFPEEISFFGSGDFRASTLKIRDGRGCCVTDLKYKSFKRLKKKPSPCGMPFAGDNGAETLAVTLADDVTGCEATLYYTVYYDTDVITRFMTVKNKGRESVKLERAMSLTLDLPSCDYDMATLYGSHYDECHLQRVPLHHGIQSVTSRRGFSSPQYNTFFYICERGATEERGDVFGFNLIWSGSYLDEVEVDQTNKTRISAGLGEENFGYVLETGEEFTTPEAVMTFSSVGTGRMTRNLHDFTRRNILPASSTDVPHPVVLNTWEGSLFDINEDKLVSFAKEARRLGFDMLVMDDGWFGERKDDWAALGDWWANPVKFKNGLAHLSDEIHKAGVKFGIWIEPEMVNPNSDLYRAHPEWALSVPGREPMQSRQQLVLDMSNPDVIEYLKESFRRTFDGVKIDYFKWDANRHMSDAYSHALPANRQDEVPYRCMLGVYSLLEWFREEYPGAPIETCSGGGGRYDLGMMRYGFQIWTSDNTDPYSRTRIQSAALTAYPAATMSCHVSNPRGNMKSLDFRYKVACGGMLGYEMDILRVSEEERLEMARQTAEYKTFEHVVRLGDYFPLVSPVTNDYEAHYYASKDSREFVFSLAEKKETKARLTKPLKIKSANAEKRYRDRLSGKVYEGRELKDGLRLELTGEPDSAVLMYLVEEE